MFKVNDKVFVQQPYGTDQILVPYVGTVVAVNRHSVYINVDLESSLTSPLVEEIAELYQQPLTYFYVLNSWATPHES